MEKRRRRKHHSHKRSLVIVNEHRPYLTSTQGDTATVDKLDRAVVDQAAALTDQENGRLEQESAADRAEKVRRWLYDAVKLFASVSATVTPAGSSMPFDGTRPANDDQLIARVEAIHAAASADPATFVKGGITPGGVDALAAQLAAFKKAKDAMTLAGKQHNEARDRFDRAQGQANQAIAVIEGVLATELDAPAGALNALRQAKRIGPRVADDVTAAEESTPLPTTPAATTPPSSTTTTTPATPPVPEKAA